MKFVSNARITNDLWHMNFLQITYPKLLLGAMEKYIFASFTDSIQYIVPYTIFDPVNLANTPIWYLRKYQNYFGFKCFCKIYDMFSKNLKISTQREKATSFPTSIVIAWFWIRH